MIMQEKVQLQRDHALALGAAAGIVARAFRVVLTRPGCELTDDEAAFVAMLVEHGLVDMEDAGAGTRISMAPSFEAGLAALAQSFAQTADMNSITPLAARMILEDLAERSLAH